MYCTCTCISTCICTLWLFAVAYSVFAVAYPLFALFVLSLTLPDFQKGLHAALVVFGKNGVAFDAEHAYSLTAGDDFLEPFDAEAEVSGEQFAVEVCPSQHESVGLCEALEQHAPGGVAFRSEAGAEYAHLAVVAHLGLVCVPVGVVLERAGHVLRLYFVQVF